jgi:HEAT repeat protein
MTGRPFLPAVFALALFASAHPSVGQDEPTPAQLVRSAGSVPSVPILRDEELTYERLKALLQSKGHVDRYTGATNLSRCSIYGWKGTPAQADELTTLTLKDVYWAVRFEGARFAYSRGRAGNGIIPALVAALDSEEPLVRAQVALALGQTGGVDEALARLKKMLATADQPLAVATALVETDAGRKALKELASGTNPTARLFSNAGLIKAGGDTAKGATEPYLQDLRAALASKDPATVVQACTSVDLVAGNAAGAGRGIAALLSHADIGIRAAAAEAILQSAPKDDAVVSALVKALDDKEIRNKCVIALGRIGEKARPAIPALVRLMEQDPSNRYVVVSALPSIDPQSPEALAAMLKVLKASIEERRPDEHVIEALGGYGPLAKAAAPDLVKAMGVGTGDPYHIPAAIWALGQIGPDAAPAQLEVEKYLNGPFRDLAAAALRRITAKDPATMPAPQQKYPGPGVMF